MMCKACGASELRDFAAIDAGRHDVYCEVEEAVVKVWWVMCVVLGFYYF